MEELAERLRSHVEQLDFARNRLDSAPAMERAESYVLDSWRAAGWKVERHEYCVDPSLMAVAQNLTPSQRSRLVGCSGANLIALRPGLPGQKVVVVAAHLDTLSHTHGADDNTSGMAGLLELAHLLEGRNFRHSVALVAFDMEEWNLLGSRAFVERKAPAWGPIRGVFNFECIGYYRDEPGSQSLPPGLRYLYPRQWRRLKKGKFRGDFSLVVHRGPGTKLARRMAAALRREGGTALRMRDPADLPLLGASLSRRFPFAYHFSRSDHAPFWERGIPALMITDTAEFRNPYYHHGQDLPHRLDYRRMAEVVRATAAVVAELAHPLQSVQKQA